jgi:hypothetical protein
VDIKSKEKIIDHMVDTIQSTNDLRDEIEMKDQLIDALQIKLREKHNQIDDMIDATSATNHKKFDASCDTKDLIEKIDATCATEELSKWLMQHVIQMSSYKKIDAYL